MTVEIHLEAALRIEGATKALRNCKEENQKRALVSSGLDYNKTCT